MAWSQGELDALKSAYAAGTRRVTFEGRTVEYDDGAALLARIRMIEAGLATAAGHSAPVGRFVTFRRG